MRNRDLRDVSAELIGQSMTTPVFVIKLQDAEQITKDEKEQADALRARLLELLKRQQELNTAAVAWQAGDKESMQRISGGQTDLRLLMQQTAQTFKFDEETKVVQKTLDAARITSQELLHALRELEIDKIDDVKFAILETNGKITAIRF